MHNINAYAYGYTYAHAYTYVYAYAIRCVHFPLQPKWRRPGEWQGLAFQET